MKINRSFRYISISHKTATAAQREYYHISQEEKCSLTEVIGNTFKDISGLLLLVTCNRTEIYFESVTTSATTIRDFFISQKITSCTDVSKQLFKYSDTTEDTAKHLLEVSSGLASLVFGDAEIIHQIKKAHQFSITHKMQGSLLERAMQTVFKSHKRISNETGFRDGTTSTAYKSLKALRKFYSKASLETNKILFIGAGDIVKQLFMYNSKFNFSNIYISNRTHEKAVILAKKYQSKVYSWDKVLANDFKDFDVIISAVSNKHHLIKNISNTVQKVLLIDLAVPSNINKALTTNKNIEFYDLESISAELENTREKRQEAIGEVNEIIDAELLVYNDWLQTSPLRSSLAKCKIIVQQKVKDYYEIKAEKNNPEGAKIITNRIMRKLKILTTEELMSSETLNRVIDEQFTLSNKMELVSVN
jgi:glutamyl-tRNA reductase